MIGSTIQSIIGGIEDVIKMKDCGVNTCCPFFMSFSLVHVILELLRKVIILFDEYISSQGSCLAFP